MKDRVKQDNATAVQQNELRQLLIAAATRLIRSEHSQGHLDSVEIHQANQLISLANQQETDCVILSLAVIQPEKKQSRLLSKIVAGYLYNKKEYSSSGIEFYFSNTQQQSKIAGLPILRVIYDKKNHLWEGKKELSHDYGYTYSIRRFYHCNKEATISDSLQAALFSKKASSNHSFYPTKMGNYKEQLQQPFSENFLQPEPLEFHINASQLLSKVKTALTSKSCDETIFGKELQQLSNQAINDEREGLYNNINTLLGLLQGILALPERAISVRLCDLIIDIKPQHESTNLDSFLDRYWHGPSAGKSPTSIIFSSHANPNLKAWREALPLKKGGTDSDASPLEYAEITPQVIHYLIDLYIQAHSQTLNIEEIQSTRSAVMTLHVLCAKDNTLLRKIKEDTHYRLPHYLLTLISPEKNDFYKGELLASPVTLNRLIQLIALHNQHGFYDQQETLPLKYIEKAQIDGNAIEQVFKITPPSDWPQIIQLKNIQTYMLRKFQYAKYTDHDYPCNTAALATARSECQEQDQRKQFFSKNNPQQAMYRRWFLALFTVMQNREYSFTSLDKKFNYIDSLEGLLATLHCTLSTTGFKRSGSAEFRQHILGHLIHLENNPELILPYLEAQLVRILCGKADVSPCGNTMTILIVATLKAHQLTACDEPIPTSAYLANTGHDVPMATVIASPAVIDHEEDQRKPSAIESIDNDDMPTAPPYIAINDNDVLPTPMAYSSDTSLRPTGLSERAVHEQLKQAAIEQSEQQYFHQYNYETNDATAIYYLSLQDQEKKLARDIVEIIETVNEDTQSSRGCIGFAVHLVTNCLNNLTPERASMLQNASMQILFADSQAVTPSTAMHRPS